MQGLHFLLLRFPEVQHGSAAMLNPASAISRAYATWKAMNDGPTYLAELQPVFEGMRKAGVPER